MKATLEKPIPSGPAAAAILAAGLGILVLGVATTLAEMSAPLKEALRFYPAAGPLSGKTTVGVVAWLISWAGLHLVWRRKDVNFGAIFILSSALIALGLLFTFPPFFELFVAE